MQMDMDEEEEEAGARSLVTRQDATTAGGWNHSKVFSEAASRGATLRAAGRQTARTARTASRAGTRQVGMLLLLVVLCDGDQHVGAYRPNSSSSMFSRVLTVKEHIAVSGPM